MSQPDARIFVENWDNAWKARDVDVVLGACAAVLTLAAFLPYIHAILYGQVRPHVFSWVIWGLNTTIACLVAVWAEGGVGAWVMGLSAVITLFIAALAYLKRADVTITMMDGVFLMAALATMPLWYWFRDPVWMALLVTVIELLGFGPTLRKTWLQPYSESLVFLGILLLRNVLIIAALHRISTATVLFPAAMAGACLVLIAIMVLRRPATISG